jgi:hypothetical protein
MSVHGYHDIGGLDDHNHAAASFYPKLIDCFVGDRRSHDLLVANVNFDVTVVAPLVIAVTVPLS